MQPWAYLSMSLGLLPLMKLILPTVGTHSEDSSRRTTIKCCAHEVTGMGSKAGGHQFPSDPGLQAVPHTQSVPSPS